MNKFLEELKKENNYTLTENGAVALKSTLNDLYDLFALGGAYRSRSDNDCILLFKNAFEYDEVDALRCLFYIRDIRGGLGERRFFRVCMKWLAKEKPEAAIRNFTNIVNMGRWDDLYTFIDTPVEKYALSFIANQFNIDNSCLTMSENEGISLLGKWLASENASSKETRYYAEKTRKYLGYSHKEYRKALSHMRTRINIVEKLMSENRWSEINYSQLPSNAGLKYRNAFARQDYDRYYFFMSNKDNKINTATLYPYDIVKGVVNKISYYDGGFKGSETEREMLNKAWEQQIDYLDGANSNTLCIIDTSGSMDGNPINIAISLGLYCAERLRGPFKDYYISFSSRPQLIKTDGVDFVDKVGRIYKTNLCDNTNLNAVFDLLLNIAKRENISKDDLPKRLVIISDMEIDDGSEWRYAQEAKTNMDVIREQWKKEDFEMPELVYWNVDARNNIILENPELPGISFVSGASPIIFKSVLTGKTGIDLMYETIHNERYMEIK